MTTLGAFLAASFGRAGRAVLCGEQGSLTLTALLSRAATIARRLPDPQPGSEVAFAFARDRAGFAAGLLATWTRGHVAVLPEGAGREHFAPLLARARNVGFLHDTGVGRGVFVPELLERVADAEAPLRLDTPLDDRVLLAAFRRAPDGTERIARWTAKGLLEDVDALARRMRLSPEDVVFSPFSPTVPPGLLAALLVPLRVGAQVEDKAIDVGEPLLTRLRGEGSRALIASAHHLRTLARLPPAVLVPPARSFCVDEQLDARHTALLARRHALFATALPGLPLEEPTPVCLADVTEALYAVPGVADVALRLQPREGKSPLALVAVAASDERADEIRHVAVRHAGSDVTCATRCLPHLPRDANGRMPLELHRLAFGLGRDGRPTTRTLAWAPVASGHGERRFRTHIPERYDYYEGHFASYPVLAGAVQVHELVLPCVRRAGHSARSVGRLQDLKFPARIAPGDEVDVLVRSLDPTTVAFEVLRGTTTCTAGRIRFAP